MAPPSVVEDRPARGAAPSGKRRMPSPSPSSSGGADAWTGRSVQVRKFLWLLGEREDDACPPILVHGPETTGKTSIVRALLERSGRPHAYTSARACGNPKNIMQSALDELTRSGWLRPPHKGAQFACDKASDLLNVLKSQRRAKSSSSSSPDKRAAYWVIDDAETLTEGSGSAEGSKFVTFLVQLRHFLSSHGPSSPPSSCNLCVILISRVSWDSFQQGSSYEENGPASLFFPAYTVSQLQEILARERRVLVAQNPTTATKDAGDRGAEAEADDEEEEVKQWKRYLNLLVPSVGQYTGSIHMVRYLASKLHPWYASDATGSAFKPKLQKVIQHMRAKGMSNVTLSEFFERERLTQQHHHQPSQQIEVHSHNFVQSLPYMGKMLLLAAYIAGWNPSSSDKRVFGNLRSAKRRRKDPMLITKKASKIEEAKLLGPGTFTVDRLLATLRSLLKCEGEYFLDAPASAAAAEEEERALSAKAHSQETYALVKTYSAQMLFTPGSVDSGSMCCEHYRLQCNLREAAALRIARSLDINLQDYLVYV